VPVVAPVGEDALSTAEAPPSVPAVQAPVGVTPVRAVMAASVRRAAAKVAAPEPAPLSALAASAAVAEASSDASIAFRQANEARQAGDHPRAGELYGMLLNRFSGSPEAHASLALFGRMLLDDGNANGALQCFDDYLRTGGALREDVMLGRALAFQRIGPRAAADEARAWSSLLDAYPGTVHTARARRRLAELQGS
jgi:TolA-binding protein